MFNINENTKWKLVSLAFLIALLVYSVNFRLIVDSATIEKCNAMLYKQYFDRYGNFKLQNVSESFINNSSFINISVIIPNHTVVG